MSKKKSKKKVLRKKKNVIESKVSPLKKKLPSKKTKSKSKPKLKINKKAKGYQRGDLGRKMFELFDKVGIDKVTFEQALKIAQAAKPDTTYGKSYFSWHKNHYRNERDI